MAALSARIRPASSYFQGARNFERFERHAIPESVTDSELRRLPERVCDLCGYRGAGLAAVRLRDVDTDERFRGFACVRCQHGAA